MVIFILHRIAIAIYFVYIYIQFAKGVFDYDTVFCGRVDAKLDALKVLSDACLWTTSRMYAWLLLCLLIYFVYFLYILFVSRRKGFVRLRYHVLW